jgi:hypothetical protein
MVLKFSVDPQTGVVVPPVTVFNGGSQGTSDKRGGKRKSKTRKGRKGSKKTRKGRKQTRRRR